MPNITINLHKLTESNSYDSIINNLLTQAALPPCLGTMTPKLLKANVEVEETELFVLKDSVDPSELTDICYNDIVEVSFNAMLNKEHANKFLTKEGLKRIEEYKQAQAAEHVAKLVNCTKCRLVDVCYKLTSLYMEAIQLLERNS